jgi:transcriptional regulator MraZ
MMFRGHYEHAIDAKGRTSLPARFRHGLPAEGDMRLVVAPALADCCLDVYPMGAWEEFEAKVARLPKWDRDTVLLRRRYVSAAVEAELDKNGRLLVPASLREHAGLVKEVLWAGVGTTMELWSRERWEAAQHLDEQELDRWRAAIAEKLDL